ncbi:hypothetical protein BU24DRAFT_38320 [Aaosphaeria arxii CBS 175.79]|uniref:SAP domain-containing protein n=1 Tax=Aaosphaeria arxii CBS 175.79 TaxID=1450172 RepID=A0A6A5Y978_9PLEO|nr:uncharacterized protein BU24DRAFT_38320 [Aaosphaeria arxii CBS 175.79]KAF2022135.1 hypothetical protein BU24DRAFT_38320 [Aaosphaeria arxii CBS 175.79]
MPEYAKMKNADLEALLKERGLQTGGKKADMVERLNKDDETKKPADAPAPEDAKAAVPHPEDEIDWDDDEEVPAAADEAATKKAEPTDNATTTKKAGGEGAIDNPQAVPNQVADIDPAKTADLSVKEPGEEKDPAEASDALAAEEKKEPPPDYTRGLAASNIDEEIEKRKARAKKFGLNIEDDEGLKKLERAKKFGETGPPQGLDEALPERSRKRGRDNDNEAGRGRDKRRGTGRFNGRRGGGQDRRRDDRGDNRGDRGDNRREDRGRANGGSNWMSEADRAKAEARKAKFAKSASAA